MENFQELNLEPHVKTAVDEAGFVTPTPIQAQAIPPILEGRDVIGIAQTGTGKTAAYVLPVLERFIERHYDEEYKGPRILILSPTRELAFQVEQNVRIFARYLEVNVAILLGGVGYGPQLKALRSTPDIIVATPGRLLDHLQQGNLTLKHVEFFILDEADRMLDMGFMPDIRRLISSLGDRKRQTLMFSATFPDPIARLASTILNDPLKIDVTPPTRTPEKIKQYAYYVEKMRKPRLLREMLIRPEMVSVMVFCGTKVEADFVYEMLNQEGKPVAIIHSDREQRQRISALEDFRAGKVAVLIATDIAARGLDIKDVTHVVNYDMPPNFEDYVHRVGRTARAEAHGEAVSLVTPADLTTFLATERKLGIPIERLEWPDITLETSLPRPEIKPLEAAESGSTPPARRRR